MEDLFSASAGRMAPLADRMRPRALDEFLGQIILSARESCCVAPSRRTG